MSRFVFCSPSVWEADLWRWYSRVCLPCGSWHLLAPSVLPVCHLHRAASGPYLLLPGRPYLLRAPSRRAHQTTLSGLWWGPPSSPNHIILLIQLNSGPNVLPGVLKWLPDIFPPFLPLFVIRSFWRMSAQRRRAATGTWGISAALSVRRRSGVSATSWERADHTAVPVTSLCMLSTVTPVASTSVNTLAHTHTMSLNRNPWINECENGLSWKEI